MKLRYLHFQSTRPPSDPTFVMPHPPVDEFASLTTAQRLARRHTGARRSDPTAELSLDYADHGLHINLQSSAGRSAIIVHPLRALPAVAIIVKFGSLLPTMPLRRTFGLLNMATSSPPSACVNHHRLTIFHHASRHHQVARRRRPTKKSDRLHKSHRGWLNSLCLHFTQFLGSWRPPFPAPRTWQPHGPRPPLFPWSPFSRGRGARATADADRAIPSWGSIRCTLATRG